MTASIRPFRIEVPESDLDHLGRRIVRTRWPPELGDNSVWQDGAALADMRALAAYWLVGFDWRAREQALNALPQFTTEIDDLPIHFVHIQGRGPAPIPLLLNHGWPDTFWDMRHLIGPLSDPAAYGADATDAFELIIPSLPGTAFSSPQDRPDITPSAVADILAGLMARLGHQRFAVQGGDIGALVGAALARGHPERVVGLHLHSLLSARAPHLLTEGALADSGPEEAGWEARTLTYLREQAAFQYVQRTRPQTLAFGLHNSPVGLAAWLLDAQRSLNGGAIDTALDRDDQLTQVMLYWVTQTLVTSLSLFRDAGPPPLPLTRPAAPTAVLQSQNDVTPCPRPWAAQSFNLNRWTVLPDDGPIGPKTTPQAIVDDLRAFFRPFRASVQRGP